MLGQVIKRWKSIHPQSLVNKIVTPTKFTNKSCKWGNDTEKNALIKYQEHMERSNSQIELCYSCGLVVNPKWTWLGASPDSLAKDLHEKINTEQWPNACIESRPHYNRGRP